MIEPINYMAALRRSWRLLLALAVVFAIVAVLLPVSKAPSQNNDPLRYRAIAIVGAPPSNGIIGSDTVSLGQILFYGNNFFLKGQALGAAKTPGPAIELIGAMSATPQTTKSSASSGSSTASTAPVVKGSAKNDTGLVQLAASAATKDEAAALVNQYATTLGNRLSAVAAAAQAGTRAATSGKSTTTTAPVTGYQVMEPAQPSTAKRTTPLKSSLTSSRKVRLIAGVLLGLIVGALVVLVVELMNKRLRLAPRAEAHFKYPVVAEIPEAWPPPTGGAAPGIVVVTEPTSRAAEAYRKLRMSVMFEALAPTGVVGNPFQDPYDGLVPMAVEPYSAPAPETRATILVVSPAAEPSRPRVVVNLGAAYAEAGQRVVIVSTSDLDSGVPVGPGASHTGPVALEDVRSNLRASSIENVSMLSLRPFVKNSAQLVGRAPLVFEAVRQIADVVLVEAPPFLQFHHGEALAHAVDVVLVVGECEATTFDGADETGVLLRRIGAPVLGVVFTEVPLTKAEKRERRGTVVTSAAAPVAEPDTGGPPEETSQYPVESQA